MDEPSSRGSGQDPRLWVKGGGERAWRPEPREGGRGSWEGPAGGQGGSPRVGPAWTACSRALAMPERGFGGRGRCPGGSTLTSQTRLVNFPERPFLTTSLKPEAPFYIVIKGPKLQEAVRMLSVCPPHSERQTRWAGAATGPQALPWPLLSFSAGHREQRAWGLYVKSQSRTILKKREEHTRGCPGRLPGSEGKSGNAPREDKRA